MRLALLAAVVARRFDGRHFVAVMRVILTLRLEAEQARSGRRQHPDGGVATERAAAAVAGRRPSGRSISVVAPLACKLTTPWPAWARCSCTVSCVYGVRVFWTRVFTKNRNLHLARACPLHSLTRSCRAAIPATPRPCLTLGLAPRALLARRRARRACTRAHINKTHHAHATRLCPHASPRARDGDGLPRRARGLDGRQGRRRATQVPKMGSRLWAPCVYSTICHV